MKCPCGLAYVGKTQRALKSRIAEHRSNIRTQDQRSPVAMHFREANHPVGSLRSILALNTSQLQENEAIKYPLT